MRSTSWLTLAFAGTLALAACGDDGGGEEAAPAGDAPAGEAKPAAGGGSKPASAAKAEPAAKPGSASNEIDRHVFSDTARDPFTPPLVEPTAPTNANAVKPDCDPVADPLGLIAPEQLRLIALITGTAQPRAMFNTQGSSPGIIAQEGAKVGPSCSARITDIRDNEVVIEHQSLLEDERVETILVLNSDRLVGATIQ
jgi:Tfp pilus assembly protein PilP